MIQIKTIILFLIYIPIVFYISIHQCIISTYKIQMYNRYLHNTSIINLSIIRAIPGLLFINNFAKLNFNRFIILNNITSLIKKNIYKI